MSRSHETVNTIETPVNRELCYSLLKNKHKRVLKSRENIFKPKCSRELKKKLKKYKLRRDGIEDPDILNVSKILVSSLRIKSPNNSDKINCNNNIIEPEELEQANYLIRMVRKKKICTEVQLASANGNIGQKEEDTIPTSNIPEEGTNKKHMDAFKLLMDSRNKSIGSNSPGKEKTDEPESKEEIERKEIKAKRVLSLQKMAMSKGSLKKKEIEEFRDKCIEKKMVKRAERLKQMIAKPDSKSEQKKAGFSKKQPKPTYDNSEIKTKPEKKALQLCDIFNEISEPVDQSKPPKKNPKQEDIEFLKKLSPSIKKKENMLSYFQKVSKDDSDGNVDDCSGKNDKSVIKVKFRSKRKNKCKVLNLTEKLTPDEAPVKKIATVNKSNQSYDDSPMRVKRKRNLNIDDNLSSPVLKNSLTPSSAERPKRNVKKPLKYSEEIFSSDEEFHIFTPKKKKNNEKPLTSKIVETTQQVNKEIDSETENRIKGTKNGVVDISKKDESKCKLNKKTSLSLSKDQNNSSKTLKLNNVKKAVKLAPIFVAKVQLSPAEIEAKQKFLNSGVPEKLKKKAETTTNVVAVDIFPSVVHIQQSLPDLSIHQVKDWFNSLVEIEEISNVQYVNLFKNLLVLEETNDLIIPVASKHAPEKILKSIKGAYPKFPVYRTYHLLSGKRKGEFKDCVYPDLDNSSEIISAQCIDVNNENPDQLNWCDKYKPTSSKQIIGNFESIKELKKWLETWTENLFKARQANDSSDSSDFYYSDTDSRDINRNTNNVLILTGQTGSGKTSCVYAVASELAIKVIEVNASSKRTGKIMLQDLQEATQSHKVDRAKSNSDNSQKLSEEIIPTQLKKRGRPKKVYPGKRNQSPDPKSKLSSQKSNENSQSQVIASQESARTVMSLILIDDADIVFEQDDGFCSAITQLIQSSKRPVILVTSSLTCPHLQRFLQYGKVLHMRPVLSRMLGTWLDIMCLADVGKCSFGLGAKVLDFYKGDIRKTINCLQFYMNSSKQMNQGDDLALSQLRRNIDDEDSSMSWVDSESSDAPVLNDTDADFYNDKLMQLLHIGVPLNVFSVWWNLPTLYSDCNNTKEIDNRNCTNIECKKHQEAMDGLSRISNVLDTISVIDYFDSNIDSYKSTNICTRPWYTSENASLFENENFECYKKSSFITQEISDILMKSAISTAQGAFKNGNSLSFPSPSASIQRLVFYLLLLH